MIKLTLPVPPLLNRLYRVKGKGLYKDPRAAVYRREVWMLCKEANIKPMAGNISLTVKWFRERKVGDIDGILKCLLDSLEDVAYFNDKQIHKLVVYKLYNKLQPRVEIEIEKFSSLS